MRKARPLRVLVVEDEALLAMDIGLLLEDCGHLVVAEAACLDEVAELPRTLEFDLALLDVQLMGGSSGVDAAALLRTRRPGLAMVFVTANPGKLPGDLGGALGVVPKPFTRTGMQTTIRWVADTLAGKDAFLPEPSSFRAAPRMPTLAPFA